ncbi:MAG: hypothetical protein ACTSRG_23370 [Candidatus Helarchaeota archaeon]
MSDPDYWKKRYSPLWGKSSSREKTIKKIIEDETGATLVDSGLGAGSKNFFPGPAVEHGYHKGDADYDIPDKKIRIEVTGPLVKNITQDQPLWIRPDKIENARKHLPDEETWVVHHLMRDNTIRVVNLDDDFFKRLDRGDFELIHPYIRGTEETYYLILASDPCVREFDVLIDRIKTK